MTFAKSPFSPKSFPKMPFIDGVKLATARAYIRYKDKDDILVIKFVDGTSVAGVFTTSSTAGSNIEHCRKVLKSGKARVLVVNSGNANVAVGIKGYEAVKEIVELCSEKFSCSTEAVYYSATGVIGQQLPVNKIVKTICNIIPKLNSETQSWYDAAVAIMTTDTYPKMITKSSFIGNTKVTINGICKGSGMIAPNMATMLGYIVTDAKISSEVLQKIMNEYVNVSFNNITVDGDTSTSDTVLMFATNKADHSRITSFLDEELLQFKKAIKEIMIEMAHLIVKDGEGIKKFITVTVKNFSTIIGARELALSIANSLLVKTAIAGNDANWGRIIMALGKCNQTFDKNKLSILIGNELIVQNGELNSQYNEQNVLQYIQKGEVIIIADMNCGTEEATVWTCDLTHDYIAINAKYLT